MNSIEGKDNSLRKNKKKTPITPIKIEKATTENKSKALKKENIKGRKISLKSFRREKALKLLIRNCGRKNLNSKS